MHSFQGKKKFQINKSIKKHCARYKYDRRCYVSSKSTKNSDSNDKFNKGDEEQNWLVIKIDDGIARTHTEYEDFLNFKTLHLQDVNSGGTDQTNYTTSSDGVCKSLCVSSEKGKICKRRLRLLADCFSFLCGICLWGIFDDLVVIMSADNILLKFCLYCTVTLISAVITFTIRGYKSEYSTYERKIDCQSLKRRDDTLLRK